MMAITKSDEVFLWNPSHFICPSSLSRTHFGRSLFGQRERQNVNSQWLLTVSRKCMIHTQNVQKHYLALYVLLLYVFNIIHLEGTESATSSCWMTPQFWKDGLSTQGLAPLHLAGNPFSGASYLPRLQSSSNLITQKWIEKECNLSNQLPSYLQCIMQAMSQTLS